MTETIDAGEYHYFVMVWREEDPAEVIAEAAEEGWEHYAGDHKVGFFRTPLYDYSERYGDGASEEWELVSRQGDFTTYRREVPRQVSEKMEARALCPKSTS